MELGLSDFLSQLGNETVNRLNRENKARQIPGTQPVKEEKKVEMPTRRERKPEPEIKQEQIIEESQEEILEEDFIETALDYANVVVKTVRKSFNTNAEKRKVFESIRSAIDIYLGEYKPQQRQSSYQPRMTEEEFNSMPTITKGQVPSEIRMNDLSGQTVNLKQEKPKGIMESDLNIGIVTGADGKKHADLSRMSNDDIYSLRVLSGIEEIKK